MTVKPFFLSILTLAIGSFGTPLEPAPLTWEAAHDRVAQIAVQSPDPDQTATAPLVPSQRILAQGEGIWLDGSTGQQHDHGSLVAAPVAAKLFGDANDASAGYAF